VTMSHFQVATRRSIFRWGWRLGSMALMVTSVGCASIGPTAVPRDRTEYLSAVAESWKEQTLLNIVRIRYGDTPSFLDVSSVISSYAIQGQLSAGGIINSNPTNVAPWSTATLGGGVAYLDRPTVSYTPLTGDKFAKSMMRPISPAGIFQLTQAGYRADFILLVTVRAMNGIRNVNRTGGEVQAADPEFLPLVAALRRLQLSQSVSLRLEKRGTEEVGKLVLARDRKPEVNRDLQLISDILHLKPGKDGEVTIVFGAVPRSDKELAVLSRSMAEILVELASGIEVPPEHIAAHRTPPSGRVANAADPLERPFVRILSGPAAPVDAYSAVRYRNTWYWIDDSDIPSKNVFTGLLLLFSLAETGSVPQVPALTIPIN
jgi:hypothetical protein